MNEERDLVLKAARAVRAASRSLLLTGIVVAVFGAVLLIIADPWAADTNSLGEFLRRAWAPLLAAVVFTVGFSLIAAAFGRFDETGNRKTWYVVVSKIPIIGGLVRWIVKRHDKEQVNAPSSAGGDDPFIKS